MKKLLTLMLCLQFLLASVAFAEDDDSGDEFIKSTQNDILVVAAAGVGGAILGLSTLSFVEKPSQHLSNIWTGAAIGIIAGVAYVAYNSAQKGQQGLEEDEEEEEASVNFKTTERVAWHMKNQDELTFREVQFGTGIFTLNF